MMPGATGSPGTGSSPGPGAGSGSGTAFGSRATVKAISPLTSSSAFLS